MGPLARGRDAEHRGERGARRSAGGDGPRRHAVLGSVMVRQAVLPKQPACVPVARPAQNWPVAFILPLAATRFRLTRNPFHATTGQSLAHIALSWGPYGYGRGSVRDPGPHL